MGQMVFREDQLKSLKALIHSMGSVNVFLVRGKKSYERSGAREFVRTLLEKPPVDSFYAFDSNPQLHDLKAGIALFNKKKYNLILAVGGGSVLDMAKLIRVLAHRETDIDVVLKKGPVAAAGQVPLLAIPTTAGSGAEATQFAVLYIDKIKHSFEHPLILPDYVYLSSEFLSSIPSYVTACTGLDALSQAMESVWSVNATQESMHSALKAIELVWNNLQAAVNQRDEVARKNMLEAAFMAGQAINQTRTTAPHAVSYAFTSFYEIPHGHAVALSLPFFLEFNYSVDADSCNDPGGVQSVLARIDKILKILNTDIRNAPALLTEFFSSIGIPIDIPDLIENFNPDVITDNVNTERLMNNPRNVTRDDVRRFLRVQQ
jgi:alcohol dehydrogenase class IV